MHATDVWDRIKLQPYDRGVLIGKTGCGKTTLARFLIEDDYKPYSVTWNPKSSDNVNAWRYHKHLTRFTELDNAEENRLIYTPHPLLAEDENDQYRFFYWIYERKYTRLYIDEATSIVYPMNKSPRFLTAVINRGRERGISTLTATQRPSGVPMNLLSESEHWYIFKLNLHQDKQRVEQITGITVEDQFTLNDYEFFHFHTSRGLFPTKLRVNLRGISNGSAIRTITPIQNGK